MDRICNTKFWDPILTWNTAIPLFTPCFLKVGLIWIPVAFFWLFAPVEIYYMSRKKKKKVPRSLLSIAKLATALLMMALMIADMIYQMIRFSNIDIPPVEYYTPFLLCITLGAITFMLQYQRKRGRLSSVVLSLFWFFLFIGTGVGYYTSMQKTFNQAIGYDSEFEHYQFTMFVLYFAFTLIQFIFHGFADLKGKPSQIPYKESPEESASFWSKLTFFWFNPMVALGYRKPLTQKDMWDLPEEVLSKNLQSEFDKHWLPIVNEVLSHQRKVKLALTRRYSAKPDEDCTKVTVQPEEIEGKKPKLSIVKPIIKTFGWELFFTTLLKLCSSLITFVNPLLLK